LVILSCVNPFAPGIDEKLGAEEGLISDQKSIEGLFQNFKYAYSFKDTLIYSQLLDKDFSFSYYDYYNEVVVTWWRDDEMMITDNLFRNAQNLNLIWNEIVSMSGDSTNIRRSFNLTVTYNPDDVENANGLVFFQLKKDSDERWRILRWYDESNY
jgi:hypothetical protein